MIVLNVVVLVLLDFVFIVDGVGDDDSFLRTHLVLCMVGNATRGGGMMCLM